MGVKTKMSIGEKFAKLTLISECERTKDRDENGKYIPFTGRFRCDCGQEKIYPLSYVKSGCTKSCGCLIAENCRRMSKAHWGRHVQSQETKYKFLWRQLTNNARIRKVEVGITKEHFIELTKQECFYCGRPPRIDHKPKNAYKEVRTSKRICVAYNGIDRIDPLVGYTVENSVACCGQCNSAKLNWSLEEFVDWIEAVHVNLERKSNTQQCHAKQSAQPA